MSNYDSNTLPPVVSIPNRTIKNVMDFSVPRHQHVYFTFIAGQCAMISHPAHLYHGTVARIHDQLKQALEDNPGTQKVVIIALTNDGPDSTVLKPQFFNADRHIDRVVCKALHLTTGRDVMQRDFLRIYADKEAVRHVLSYCSWGSGQEFSVPTETYEVDLSFLVEQDVLQYPRKKQQQYSIACVREAFNSETAELMKYSTQKMQKFIRHYLTGTEKRGLNDKEAAFLKSLRLISSCVTKPRGDNITIAYGEYSRTLNKQFGQTKQLVIEMKKEIDQVLYPNWVSTLDGTASSALAGYAKTVASHLTK